jgi:hypothetical protein
MHMHTFHPFATLVDRIAIGSVGVAGKHQKFRTTTLVEERKKKKERKEMGLLVLQELLRSLMKQADDVLLAPSSSLFIFSGLFFKEFLSRESSSSSSTTQKSILHSQGSEVCNCRSRLRTLSFMAAAGGEEGWKLPPHPKIPKGKKVTIIILDGWGENISDRFNAIAVAETPAMDHLKTVMNSPRPMM